MLENVCYGYLGTHFLINGVCVLEIFESMFNFILNLLICLYDIVHCP